MTSAAQQHLRKLIRQYNIHFDRGDRTHWPLTCQETFANIKALGEKNFEAYCESITVESEEKPWRAQTKRRAERIAEFATRCLEERKNEAGWRMNLESEILARFTIEVNCRKCRARLWRSELEAEMFTSSPDESMQALQARRDRRTRCTCGPNGKSQDPLEQGLNPLFDDRAEEFILYEPQLNDILKKRQRPDRIYGLRATEKLNKLLRLKAKDESGTSIQDHVRVSPFRSESEPLLFPFLVLEAKSEKGSDGFSAIESQAAFAIRALLKLQEELRNATQRGNLCDNEPLVWFLSNKGEEWRVAAAHVEQDKGVPHYRVSDLWSGRILEKDGALQILLILDYVFDWARDIYRDKIISQLRALATFDASSLAGDSDTFSRGDHVNSWIAELALPATSEQPALQVTPSIPETLRQLDRSMGAVRDARFFQARFHALHVTQDNLNTFLLSELTPARSRMLARNLQRLLKDAVRVSGGTLDAIQTLWTKNEPCIAKPTDQARIFLAKFNVAAYLDSSWELVIELTYVATEEAALNALSRHSPTLIKRKLCASRLPFVHQDQLFDPLQTLRSRSSQRDMLQAAIGQRCALISSKFVNLNEEANSLDDELGSVTEGASILKISTDSRADVRHLALSFYNRYKVGMREPSETFLRHSSCKDERPSAKETTSFWHDVAGEASPCDLASEAENVVSLIETSSSEKEICLYLVGDPFDYMTQSLRVPLRMDSQRHYTPQRHNISPGSGDHWNSEVIRTSSKWFKHYFTMYCDQLKAKRRVPRTLYDHIKEALDSEILFPPHLNALQDAVAPISKVRGSAIDEGSCRPLIDEILRLGDMEGTAKVPAMVTDADASRHQNEPECSTREGSLLYLRGRKSGSDEDILGSSKRPVDLTIEDTNSLSIETPLKRPAIRSRIRQTL